MYLEERGKRDDKKNTPKLTLGFLLAIVLFRSPTVLVSSYQTSKWSLRPRDHMVVI